MKKKKKKYTKKYMYFKGTKNKYFIIWAYVAQKVFFIELGNEQSKLYDYTPWIEIIKYICNAFKILWKSKNQIF